MRLYSDDFGYSPLVDKAILKLVRRDKLFGLSVIASMVSPVRLKQLVQTLNGKKNTIVGLHINLIEGIPLQHFLKVKTLVDQNGNFYPFIIFLTKLFLKKLNLDEIKSEIKSQLEHLSHKGIKVKMLDSHQHTHAFSPIAEIVGEVAKEHNVANIRNFRSIKTHSLKGKLTLFTVKILAFFSYLLSYRKIGLPLSWRPEKELDWTVLSWEANTFDIADVKSKKAAFVIHPYLTFDSNKSYRSFIK